MNKIFILLASFFFIVGCVGFEPEVEGPFEILINEATIFYDGYINLPTPCHQSSSSIRYLDDRLVLNIQVIEPDPERVCAQVITPRNILGNINYDDQRYFEVWFMNEVIQRVRI